MNDVALAFAVPFLFMGVFLVLRRLVPPTASESAHGDQHVRLRVQIGIACALLAFALWSLPAKVRSAQTYRTDWTCRQGTELSTAVRSGPCTVDAARLTAAPSGRRPTLFVSDISNGASLAVGLDTYLPRDSAIWRAVRAAPGISGKVQYLNDQAVLVATGSESVSTAAEPSERLATTESFAAFGAGLLIASLLEILVAPFVLPPGW